MDLKLDSHGRMRQKKTSFSTDNIYQGRTAQSGGKGVNDNVRLVRLKQLQTASAGCGHQLGGLGRKGSSCEFSMRVLRGFLGKNLTNLSFSLSHSFFFPSLVTGTVFILLSFYGPVPLFPFPSKSNTNKSKRKEEKGEM